MDSSDTDGPLVNVYTYLYIIITQLKILELYRQEDRRFLFYYELPTSCKLE